MKQTVDSFSYGKRGRRLSESEQLVRRLITWHDKTLQAALHNRGVSTGGMSRQTMIVELAFLMLKKDGSPAG